MFKWLDVIDQNELHTLLLANNLQLNNSTRSFLESFAHLVSRASSTRHKLLNAAIARNAQVHTVNSVIAYEVSHLQRQHPYAQIIPYRHPETSLPIVYVRLQSVPDLVVHVYRSYANTRRGLAFGFRVYSFCRSHLTGPLARAANYLRARCTADSWNLSLSNLVTLWCEQVAAIPIHERKPTPTPRAKPIKMMRRRRQQKPSSPPPLVPDNSHHASLPQHHPKTDVIIKDDRLFPNRTFDDPEQLYAEQVRAIRKKRKPVPGVLDDYELAWKKRHLEPHPAPPSEQPQSLSDPLSDPPSEPQRKPLPSHQHSLVLSQDPANNVPDTPQPSAPQPSEPPEELEFSFLNPLSPESKDQDLGDARPLSPQADKKIEKAQNAEQDTAAMEVAERAVLSKPASSQPPHAATTDCGDDVDDSAPPVFSFSTGMDDRDPPTVDSTPTVGPETEEETRMEGNEPTVISSPAGETPVGNEELIRAPAVFQPLEDREQNLAQKEADPKSGGKDIVNSDELLFSFPQRINDQHHLEGDETGTPTTLNEVTTDSPQTLEVAKLSETNRRGQNGAKDASKQLPDRSNSPPISASPLKGPQLESPPLLRLADDVPENANARDIGRRGETVAAADGTSPSNTVSQSSNKPETDDVKAKGDQRIAEAKDLDYEKRDPRTEIVESKEVGKDFEGTPDACKKRSREIQYSADVILVDPYSDEEDRTRNAKKRRLSPTVGDGFGDSEREKKATDSLKEADHVDSPKNHAIGEEVTKTTDESKAHTFEKSQSEQPEEQVVTAERKAERSSNERLVERSEKGGEEPSPRNVSIWTPEHSKGDSYTNTPNENARKAKETRHEAGTSRTTKEVTQDMEQTERRFSSARGMSRPVAVDRDPCPMALSDPSESSEESSERGFGSDAGSVCDDAGSNDER